jgi:D-glycero-D-manno-heptose 1,7-bisphosphate phosphatase
MSGRAAFLDRDGTLNTRPAPHDYVRSADHFSWLPGAAAGAARFAAAGFRLVVVSNQRGVARGLLDTSVLEKIEVVIQRELAEHGCQIDSFRYCTHELSENCDCRKPKPGLLLAAAAELDLDLRDSWIVGDSETDVQAGHAAGCRAALIGRVGTPSTAEITAVSLDAASALIVGRDRVGAI